MAPALAAVEQELGAASATRSGPLLVSVRSGAPVSMPGMMDTVLNLGLNDQTVEGLAAASGDPPLRLGQLPPLHPDVRATSCSSVDHYQFEEALEDAKQAQRLPLRHRSRRRDAWPSSSGPTRRSSRKATGKPFPQDPQEQLWGAIGAVFGSWMTPRAVTYRRLQHIPSDMGTAVTVQAMVFGNMGDDCATGVAFTRNPSTGEKRLLRRVPDQRAGRGRGRRHPHAAAADPGMADGSGSDGAADGGGAAAGVRGAERPSSTGWSAHYRDMQDIEFTIQRGKLFILQTRIGQAHRAGGAQDRRRHGGRGLITREEAILRVDPASLDQLLHPTLDPKAERKIIAKGLPASPGAVSGKVVFSADQAEKLAAAGEAVILVRIETSPDDIHGMHAAKGILTSRGGMTSHAAVVARGMGKACVCGAGDVVISYAEKAFTAKGVRVAEGDVITIDGADGHGDAGRGPDRRPAALRRLRDAHGVGRRAAAG